MYFSKSKPIALIKNIGILNYQSNQLTSIPKLQIPKTKQHFYETSTKLAVYDSITSLLWVITLDPANEFSILSFFQTSFLQKG